MRKKVVKQRTAPSYLLNQINKPNYGQAVIAFLIAIAAMLIGVDTYDNLANPSPAPKKSYEQQTNVEWVDPNGNVLDFAAFQRVGISPDEMWVTASHFI